VEPEAFAWIDGRVRRRAEAGIPVDDSAYADGRGCYTAVRISRGRPVFEGRHLHRLARGARALGLGALDPREVGHALRDLAAAAFPSGEGIVRVQVSRGRGGAARVVGIPRALGADPPVWTAITAPILHEGLLVAGGHKLTNRLVHALAWDAAHAAGADEALLFDRDGFLVEGARSNLVVVDAEDRLATPPLARGAVAGVAREVLVDRVPELRERDVHRRDLASARAVVCTNAGRGVRPLGRLDGEALPGASHPWVKRLTEALTREAGGEVGSGAFG
jgi:branched-subunit amino acid aminotransferase/4-amino-4-deoxychorismate lyase